jgi:hypothetical protein
MFSMVGHTRSLLISAALGLGACVTHSASAASPPADPCSLLPASAVSKILGSPYEAPQSSVAPRPFRDTVEGTDCTYRSGGHGIQFRIYFDPSPADAKSLFARLRTYYGGTDAPGVGDEAYIDKKHAIHGLKSNVRYFISGTADEVKIRALAGVVTGSL